MSQYTEFFPVRVSEKQKARLRRLARHGARTMAAHVRKLIDEDYAATFPERPADVPATIEARCGVCDAPRAFVWQASWQAMDMRLELYNCPTCGATRTHRSLLQDLEGQAHQVKA